MSVTIQKLLHKLTEDIKTEDVSLFLRSYVSPDSYLELFEVACHSELKNLAIPRNIGIVSWVANQKEPVIANDTINDPRFSDLVDWVSGYRTKSILALPLYHNKIFIGVLEAINKKEGAEFTEDDLKLTQEAAEKIIPLIPPEKLTTIMEMEKE